MLQFLDGRRPHLIKSNRGAQATYGSSSVARDGDDTRCIMAGSIPACKRRKLAFLGFILGNLLWIVWGVYVEAYALALLDGILCGMNIRGFMKNRTATQRGEHDAL